MSDLRVDALAATAYRVPTEQPEADGTFAWDGTTLVLVEATGASGERGVGWTYGSRAAVQVVDELLAPAVVGGTLEGEPGGGPPDAWTRMLRSVRNVGLPGIAATAISAVDVALWDLRARLAGLPLFRLLGSRRLSVEVYGSGGFTTYTGDELAGQLRGWVDDGIRRVKIKVGADRGARPAEDLERVRAARAAIGARTELFVDANGAYPADLAIRQAHRFAEEGVTYLEEPVPSDHLDQLAAVRARSPIAVAAGEYAYAPWHFRDLLVAGAVDVLQADATRCLGITGFLQAGALAHAFGVPFSAHTAPTIHAHAGCAVPAIEHVEWFHDHVRIEERLFEGVPRPIDGFLHPDPQAPGLGVRLRHEAAEPFRLAPPAGTRSGAA